MKRFLTILLTTLALAGVLCVSASASSFDDAAAELSAIGMFRGTAGGFDLDSAPTRGQAAIMLVRLFGAETQAQNTYRSGRITCPFTDVSETVAPYAAWLAEEGLAAGITETTFGASEPCTAKAYTIFLLRALGYKDRTDFTTINAESFAQSLGLLDTSLFSGKFLRDDLAAMTYQALGADLKDGSTYLLDSLIKSGAVDASAAKPITDKIEAYRALMASSQAMAQAVDAGIDAKMDISVGIKGQSGGISMDITQKMNAAVTGSIQMMLDNGPQMAADLTITLNDGENSETEKVEYWLKDGAYYIRSGETAYQMDTGIDMETLKALIEQSNGNNEAAMLPFIGGITAKISGGDTIYTLTLNNAVTGLIDDILTTVMGAVDLGADIDMKMSLGSSVITYTVDKDGALKNATVKMTVKVDVGGPDGQDAMAMNLAADLDMKMDVKSSGSAVKISFPDFSDFEEITAGADASAIGVIGGADGPTAIITTAV